MPVTVMTKEKLDKQLMGQSSTPYISLKTHPSEKCKICQVWWTQIFGWPNQQVSRSHWQIKYETTR